MMAMMHVVVRLDRALVKLEGHLARLFCGFATRCGKVSGMGAEVMKEFLAARATNFKQYRETFPPVVLQEAALTARIRSRALHRMAGSGSSELWTPGDVVLRSSASASRALSAPLFGDAVVLASRNALLPLSLPWSVLRNRLLVVVMVRVRV